MDVDMQLADTGICQWQILSPFYQRQEEWLLSVSQVPEECWNFFYLPKSFYSPV